MITPTDLEKFRRIYDVLCKHNPMLSANGQLFTKNIVRFQNSLYTFRPRLKIYNTGTMACAVCEMYCQQQSTEEFWGSWYDQKKLIV